MNFKISFIYIFISLFFSCKSQDDLHIVNDDIFGFATSNTFTYCDINDTFFVNKVKDMNPNVLRFPGGAMGNFYHYGGIGYGFDFEEIEKYDAGKFVERSQSLYAAALEKGHTYDYINDFITLAKHTNSKVILVANMFANNDDIIKMIRHIQSHDIEIIGVELGSELSNRSFYIKGYTIDNYIEDAKLCSDRIKNEFPNMRTGIVAAPLHTNPLHRHSIWNKRLAQMDFFDNIIIHSYAKVLKGKKEYGEMIKVIPEADTKEESFNIYRDRTIDFIANKFPQEIKGYNILFNKDIWITEWNFQMSRITANTMLQALFVSNYLLSIMSNNELSSIVLTTYHNLGGRDYGGSIFRGDKEYLEIHSTYTPFKMIGEVFKKDITHIDCKVEDNIMIYQCYNSQRDLDLVFIINWNNKMVNFKLDMNQNARLHHVSTFYSDNLFDNADRDGKLKSKDYDLKKNHLVLDRYSITMISSFE